MKYLGSLKAAKTPVDNDDVLRKADLSTGGTSLDNIATILMGDATHFSLANAVVTAGGTGYVVGDDVVVEPVTGLQITLPVIDVGPTGAILNVSFPYVNEAADFSTGTNSIPATGGTGTGATFKIVTMYGVGLETLEGLLSLVPSQDPLVQYSMLVGYVRDILKTRFPVETADIADHAVTAVKIDDGAIFAGEGITIIKTASGIEISADGSTGDYINVTFTNYDQDGNLI